MSSHRDRGAESAPASPLAPTRRPPGGTARGRARIARGPLVIGEPSVSVRARLAAGDPYRPDTIVDGGCALGLTVRAASVRGLAKRCGGGPRQDDICLGRHEPTGTLILAVADGVSGAARSDLAAALAVRHAVAAVSRQLDLGADVPDWDDVFGQAAWATGGGASARQRRLADRHRAGGTDPLHNAARRRRRHAGENGASPVCLASVGDSRGVRAAQAAAIVVSSAISRATTA